MEQTKNRTKIDWDQWKTNSKNDKLKPNYISNYTECKWPNYFIIPYIESLCYTPKTNVMGYVNYILIFKKTCH